MSWLTTHILDVTRGLPAPGVAVLCELETVGNFTEVARGATDVDGRLKSLFAPNEPLKTGIYRLTFETGTYFSALHVTTLYPRVQITFEAKAGELHYHVPLLLSPFGYTTYRGT